jgi:chitin deacetylase
MTSYPLAVLLALSTVVAGLRVPHSSLRLSSIGPQLPISKTSENTSEHTFEPRNEAPGVHGVSPITLAPPTGFDPNIQAQQPVPQWLRDFTGLSEWPGLDPPYIPMDFIDLSEIPDITPYSQGICPGTRDSCSFDCFKCVEPDDAFTCPKLSQSFDDGPSPATPKLLDHLKNKSSFFTLGVSVIRYPEIYHEIQRQGHLLGSHTWSHKFLPSLSNEQIIAQLQWSIWAMNATGHHLPRWFRPPYGGIDNRVRHILRKFGLRAALWDRDTFDWQVLSNERTPEQVFENVRSWMASSNTPSGLILEHDGTFQTVDVGIQVNDIIGADQWTVAQCMGDSEYMKVFDHY